MKLDFSGKTVLVVGGSSGIGNGIAQSFRHAGGDVHVWGTRQSASDYDPNDSDLDGLHYMQVDVSDESNVANAAPGFPRLDVLVCCQGVVRYGRQEFEMPTFRNVVDVNLVSVMACANKFHEMLAASRGALITVSSVAAFSAARGNPAYSASKAGCVALTRSLADAFGRDGIRVNGIAPGLVDTKLTKVTTENPKRLQAVLQKAPAGRVGTPEDMAGVALFLASPLASYVYGQTIVVDGGLLLA